MTGGRPRGTNYVGAKKASGAGSDSNIRCITEDSLVKQAASGCSSGLPNTCSAYFAMDGNPSCAR